MNGDTYSSRGMASSSTKPREESGASTDKRASADSRHGSSRDYHVGIPYLFAKSTPTNNFRLEMTDVGIEIDDVRDHQDNEGQEILVATEKIPIRRAVITENESAKRDIRAEIEEVESGHGIGTVILGVMPEETMTDHHGGIETYSATGVVQITDGAAIEVTVATGDLQLSGRQIGKRARVLHPRRRSLRQI